jgi:outer membrane protein, heavy metal efflux system
MFTGSKPVLVALLAFSATGCAGYVPKPIAEREVLRQLQAVRLEALRPASRAETPGTEFDPTDGLSSDEAVAVALFLNPDLRAFRKERGVAEGELIAAGLLPNPQFQVTWFFVQGITRGLGTAGWDVGLNWAPPRPGERGAKVARAQARIEEVRAQVAGEERRLATEVRKAYATLGAAEQRIRLIDVSMALQERLRKLVQDKLAAGDATRLDANVVELDYADRRREQAAILNDRDRARLDLNRLLGLPPAVPLVLQDRADLLHSPLLALDPSVLETTMVEQRDDLKAAKQEYEQAEQQLRMAYIQRIPWFTFGPAFQRNQEEGGPLNSFGIGFTLDLPLANLNQGEITRLEGVRDKLQEAFVARVHGARAEVYEALRNLRGQERLVQVYQEVVRPALDESARLADASLELGDVNALQFVTSQDKALKGRRDGIEAQLEYAKAIFDLERAVGARVTDMGGQGGSQ